MSNEDTTKYIQGKLLQEHRRGLDAHYRTEIFTEHGVRVATVDLCPEDVPNGQVYLRGGTARRLVAAWNACRHLTTEQLEAGDLDYAGCSTLADIRTALGVGGKPMLGELAGMVGRLKRERDEAVEALRPFAGLDMSPYEGARDERTFYQLNETEITVGDIRKARAVLAKIEGNKS